MLRLIAGLETADSGNIFLGNEDITHTPIYQRRVNTVFQNYALFPWLTALENTAFGLRMQGVPRKERDRIAREKLEENQQVMDARGINMNRTVKCPQCQLGFDTMDEADGCEQPRCPFASE